MASRKIANNYIPMRKSTTFDILNHLALLMTICLLPMIASTAETSSKVPLDPVYISEFVDTYAKQEGWAYGIWKAPNGKIGMNASIRCASVYNEALRGASEVDKAAMGVATSVLALIPALLAFTAWYTANIQTLYYLDSDAALNTAGLTLCFDVKTLDTLAKDRILSAAIILVKGGESILDSIIQRGNTWRSDIENLYTPGGPLEFLKKECVEFANKKSLESPNDDAAETLKRPNMIHVHVQTFLFFVLQVALMFAITSGVDQIAVASFIWLCPNLYYIAYLSMLVTAYIAAFVVRGLFYSTWYREAEIFFLEPIPEGQQPETLNPLLSVFEDPDRFLSKSPRTKLERHHANFKEFMWPDTFYNGTSNFLKVTIRVFAIYFTRLFSPHPQVLVLRKKFDGPGPIFQWFIGATQLLYTGFASFFFASMIFSSLVYAIVYVAFMVTTIAGSRLSSILLCRWLETRLNLLIIEYETDQERIALRTIIAAMPDALVHSQTHHYKYLNGHRIYAEEEATDTEMYIGGQSFTWVCGVWKCVIGLLLGAVMGVGLTLSGLYSIEKKSEWDTTTVKRAIIFCVPVSAIFTFLFAGRIVRGMRGAAGYKIQNSQPEVPLQTTETAASVDIEKTEAPYVDGEKTTSQSEAVVSINIDDKKE